MKISKYLKYPKGMRREYFKVVETIPRHPKIGACT